MQNKIDRGKFVEVVWLVMVIVLFVVSIKMIRSGELQSQIAGFGIWAPLIIFFLKASTLIIAPLGGTPLYIVSGALFGGVKGLLICFVGDIFGSTVCFFLSRRYGAKVLNFFAGPQNVEKVLNTVNIISNTKSFTKARLGFVSMPELLSYAAGLSRINFWTFSFINALFYLPIDFGLVFLGTRLAEIGAKYYLLLPVLIALVALSGFAMLYKDYQKQSGM